MLQVAAVVVHGIRVMVLKVVMVVQEAEDVELLVHQMVLLPLMVLRTLVEVEVDLERP
tara:strand:+ start:496 stop:669 length:174 start_codon:yes stop_codon:yes gene_type:complete